MDFFIKSPKFQLIISDPLYLLKIIRSRFKHKIRFGDQYQFFDFDIQRFKELTSLPSIAFDRTNISKMHDSLPLVMFSTKTLFESFNKNKREAQGE